MTPCAWFGCMFHTSEKKHHNHNHNHNHHHHHHHHVPHLFPFQAEHPACNSQGLSNVGSKERTWPPSAVHRSHPSCIKSWKPPGHQPSSITWIHWEVSGWHVLTSSLQFAKAHCHLQHGCRGRWTWQPDRAQQRAYHQKVVTGCTKQWLAILLLEKET